jgi:hypothetical protein
LYFKKAPESRSKKEMSTFRLETGKSGVGGRIGISFFFLIFGGMGLLFCGLLLHEVWQTAQTYGWKESDCLIIESQAVAEGTGESPYHFKVRYQYTWEGKTFTSEKVSRKSVTFSEFSKAQKLAEQFKPGQGTICYVNGDKPSEAILKRDGFWIALVLFLPLIFVAIGFGGLYFTWRKPKEADAAESGPVTDKAKQPKWLAAFFGVFFIAGAAVAWFAGIHPLLSILAAKSWEAVPCTVLSSRVQSHSSDDGSTYSIDILYGYEFKGHEYKSSRYDFVTGSSSGHQAKADVVRQYPAGKKTSCFVNPNDPTEAVLNRGFRMAILGWGLLFPIPFLAVGLGGMIWTFRKKEPGLVSATTLYRPSVRPSTTANVALKGSRFGKFIGLLIFAALWNGFIFGLPVREVWQSWQHHHFNWFLALFMIPFVGVGLFMLGLAGHSFLALFNPNVVVTLSPQSPSLGELIQVHWEVQGNTARLARLRIYLEGREEAQREESHGTGKSRRRSTHTSKDAFATLELANLDRAGMASSGDTSIRIPADTMPTFTASHNKIIWAIHAKGEIPRWPDIDDEFTVVVRPMPVEQIAKS